MSNLPLLVWQDERNTNAGRVAAGMGGFAPVLPQTRTPCGLAPPDFRHLGRGQV
jgi:hypothetical protein